MKLQILSECQTTYHTILKGNLKVMLSGKSLIYPFCSLSRFASLANGKPVSKILNQNQMLTKQRKKTCKREELSLDVAFLKSSIALTHLLRRKRSSIATILVKYMTYSSGLEDEWKIVEYWWLHS